MRFSKCDHQELAKARAQVLVRARAAEQCEEEPSRLAHELRNEPVEELIVR